MNVVDIARMALMEAGRPDLAPLVAGVNSMGHPKVGDGFPHDLEEDRLMIRAFFIAHLWMGHSEDRLVGPDECGRTSFVCQAYG